MKYDLVIRQVLKIARINNVKLDKDKQTPYFQFYFKLIQRSLK